MSYPSTVEWQRYCHSLGLTKKLEEQPSEIRLPIKMMSTTNNELGRRKKVGPVAISPSILGTTSFTFHSLLDTMLIVTIEL